MGPEGELKGPTIRESLEEYGRGIAGGLLFSLPLLYTMEVWWAGFIAEPWRLLVYVVGTFALLIGYNRYAGLRHDASFREVLIDSVEEMGLGLLGATLVLFLLNRITIENGITENLGKIVIEGMAVAIGVSVGTAQLGAEAERNTDKEPNLGGQATIALCGAVIVAANIAPTEEIVMIAIESPAWKLLLIGLASVALAAVVLHYSAFRGSRHFTHEPAVNRVVFSTVVTYAVALLASAYLLWFYGRLEQVVSGIGLAQIVVLGLPAVLGASAGRLLLQR